MGLILLASEEKTPSCAVFHSATFYLSTTFQHLQWLPFAIFYVTLWIGGMSDEKQLLGAIAWWRCWQPPVHFGPSPCQCWF